MLKYFAPLVVLFVSLALAAPVGGQQVTFRFNPPNGITFTQTDTQSMTRKATGEPSETQTQEQKTKTVIKKTAKGFTFTQTPLAKTTVVGGKRTTVSDENPAGSTPVTLVLDATGKALSVQGFEKLQQQMLARVTDETRKKGIDEKTVRATFVRLAERQKTEWGQAVSIYAGRTVKLGESWRDDTKPDENGIIYKRVITFGGMKTIRGKNCIRISYVITSDPASVRTALAKIDAARTKALAAQKTKKTALPKFVSLSAREEGERYLDPNTMLAYGETVTGTRTQVVDMPGKGKITISAMEKKVTTYDFK